MFSTKAVHIFAIISLFAAELEEPGILAYQVKWSLRPSACVNTFQHYLHTCIWDPKECLLDGGDHYEMFCNSLCFTLSPSVVPLITTVAFAAGVDQDQTA